MDPFRQLQALTLVVLALLFAPVMPPLRPLANRLRLAAIVLYFAGGVAILANWLLFRR